MSTSQLPGESELAEYWALPGGHVLDLSWNDTASQCLLRTISPVRQSNGYRDMQGSVDSVDVRAGRRRLQ